MHVVATRETENGEFRAALVPTGVEQLVKDGFDVSVQSGIGLYAGFSDQMYSELGANVEVEANKLLNEADIALHVRKPNKDSVSQLKSDAIHISFLDPFLDPGLVESMAQQRITAVSLEMVPRSTRAQKMDALSSQASLAGYAAVITAAYHLPRIFPMMMTPAGTISPTRVFVIGAGVAGLQAIATAHRLGARIEAFDTRPVVAEEVRSLGAKFVEIDIGETGQTEQGYAKALTPEQIEMQRKGMAKVVARSDVVITTAQVFGRRAPKIVTSDMIQAMDETSVVVDMAVETGGNVEGSQLNQIVECGGVKIVGLGNLPSHVAGHASEMYSSNLVHFIREFNTEESGTIRLDPENDIAKACVLTRDGQVLHAFSNGK
ncbi:MAG: NAD(P) transhydrogenase subunit alpha [Gammaproteobacteria bacterium]|nr:NAD(P) transhydrogenase subunit alpha [Gammaproteobacteria bacterium]